MFFHYKKVLLILLCIPLFSLNTGCTNQENECHPADPYCNPWAILLLRSVCLERYDRAIFSNASLAAYWKLDDVTSNTVVDYVGNLNATSINDPQTRLSGPFADSASSSFGFNGLSQVVETSDVATTAVDNVSFGIWMYPESPVSAATQMFLVNGATGANGYHMNLQPSGFIRILNGSIGAANSSYIPEANVWIYVVATRENATWKLYVNGIEQSLVGTPSMIAPAGKFKIGSTGPSFENFKGRLAHAAVWNSALNQSEIQSHVFLSRCI